MSASGTLKPLKTVSTSAGSVISSVACRCMPSSCGSAVPNESAAWGFMKYDVFCPMSVSFL